MLMNSNKQKDPFRIILGASSDTHTICSHLWPIAINIINNSTQNNYIVTFE